MALVMAILFAVANLGGPLQARRVVGMDYPRIARQARITGTVVIECVVGADGRLKEARLVSGQPLLGKAAQSNAKEWEFSGRGHIKLVYTFGLVNEIEDGSGRRFVFEAPNQVHVTAEYAPLRVTR